MSLYVLRIGHRPFRDQRITTHVFLAARALGCRGGYYSGQRDKKLEETIKTISDKWGGDFYVKFSKNWKDVIRGFKGKKVHLTAYGIPVKEKIGGIRKEKKLLIIVGGEKVPAEAYKMADYNIAITNQPHSEVSALAVFLHEYFKGKELDAEFRGKIRISPQERGKKVIATPLPSERE